MNAHHLVKSLLEDEDIDWSPDPTDADEVPVKHYAAGKLFLCLYQRSQPYICRALNKNEAHEMMVREMQKKHGNGSGSYMEFDLDTLAKNFGDRDIAALETLPYWK